MSEALDLLIEGKFKAAIAAYEQVLLTKPTHRPSQAGLASALMGAGEYEKAIPLKWHVHEDAVADIPDTCGQLVDLACAYWCIEDRARAIEVVHSLVAGNLARKINMAPDLAGGASFGLLLYYMAVTAGIAEERDYATAFLAKLKAKYDKSRPTFFGFPKVSVQQLFGNASFEDAVESASGERSLRKARAKAEIHRMTMINLSIVLFNDGVFRRAQGDEAGCATRMREVFDLGYRADANHWYLARHEVG